MIEESYNKTGGSSESDRAGREPKPATRVLLADADIGRRRRLRELLEDSGYPSLLIAAEASTRDPESVLRRARSLRPEAVALGLGGTGDVEVVELARTLKGSPKPPRVVLFGEWRDGASGLLWEDQELFLVFSLAETHVSDSRLVEDLAVALAGRGDDAAGL